MCICVYIVCILFVYICVCIGFCVVVVYIQLLNITRYVSFSIDIYIWCACGVLSVVVDMSGLW